MRDPTTEFLSSQAQADHTAELARLVTLLRHASGGVWALALYDSVAIQAQIVARLRTELAPLPVLEESLGPDRADPLSILQTLPVDEGGAPVVCFTSVEESFPDLFGYLDLQRETLAQTAFRLVLWVTDYGWRTLAGRAPNFYSRLGGLFDFQTGFEVAVEQLRRELPPLARDAVNSPQPAEDDDLSRRINLLVRRVRDLETLPDVNPETIANTLYDLGSLYRDAGRSADAAGAFTRAASFYARRGQSNRQAEALLKAGLEQTDESAGAGVPLLEQAAAVARAGGDRYTAARALRSLGDVYFELGNLARANTYYRQAQETLAR